MTPIFPNERLVMERAGGTTAMRIVDLIRLLEGRRRLSDDLATSKEMTTLLKDVANLSSGITEICI